MHSNIYNTPNQDMSGVAVPFSNEWKSVAIMVSGGADSALLSYIICDHIRSNELACGVQLISAIRCWKTRPWQRYNSIEVYGYLKNKFPEIHIDRNETYIAPAFEHGQDKKLYTDEWGNLAPGDSVHLTSYAEYVCSKKKVPAVYNAVTKNPPKDAVPEGLAHRYNPRDGNITFRDSVVVIQPFKHLDKKQLYKIYRQNEIMDLFNITRSCEGEFKDLDHTNYEPHQEVPTCGECFWCRERNWAINE